jgi:hypothetical protein
MLKDKFLFIDFSMNAYYNSVIQALEKVFRIIFFVIKSAKRIEYF